MFESALVESSQYSVHRSSVWTKGLSFCLEFLLLGLAVLIPLLYTEALPRHVLGSILEVPAPPPPAPAPRSQAMASHTPMHSELNNDQIMMPRMIPKRIQVIRDEAEVQSSSSDGGGVEGIPFGVGRGTADPTIANLIHNLPATIPKSVATQTIRVSSGVAQGLLIHEVRPQYPSLARSARIQGTVVLQATISKDGKIENLHLVSGHPLLVQAAMDAVRQWRYRPYQLNTQPVEVDTTIQVNFTLSGAQ